MKKQEATRELISSIDRIFEIEADYGFEHIFSRDWVALGRKNYVQVAGEPHVFKDLRAHKEGVEYSGYRNPDPEGPKYIMLKKSNTEYVQVAGEVLDLNAQISALAIESGLRERGWDAEVSFNSYRCEHRKHVKEYYSPWGKSRPMPRFVWSVIDKLRILREEALICQSKEAGAERTGQKAVSGKRTVKKKRGRPKVKIKESQRRRKIKAEWEQYRDTIRGSSKESFCNDYEDEDGNITVEYLNNCVLRWCLDHPNKNTHGNN